MQKITPFLWFDGQAEEADELLYLDFQEFKVVNMVALWDAVPVQGKRDDRGFSTGWPGFCCAQWRAAVQIYAGHLVRGEL